MEYCPLGDVHSYYTRRGIPPENYTRTIIWQVLRGLHYLHHLDIAHRDLKPRNILIMEAPPTSTNLWVKLADFGVAKRAKSSDTTITQQRSRCGTQGYMAPEVVWSDGKGYTKACDIWSLGCTQLWLFSQEKLNYNDFIDDKRTQIQQNLINRGFSSDAVDFISQALSRKPEDRPTPGQALSMSWFRGVVTKVESSIGPDNAFENHAHTAYTSTGLFSSGSPCSMTFFPSNHGAGDEPEGMGDDDDTFKESKRPMPGQFYQSVPEPRNPQRGFVPKMLNSQYPSIYGFSDANEAAPQNKQERTQFRKNLYAKLHLSTTSDQYLRRWNSLPNLSTVRPSRWKHANPSLTKMADRASQKGNHLRTRAERWQAPRSSRWAFA